MVTPQPQDLFEAFQKMMNPMALPFQHLLMPALSIEEVDKKLSELEAVQKWLTTSVNMVELSIKSLEYQRALLDPASKTADAPSVPPNPFLDPKLWSWSFPTTEEKKETPKRAPSKKRAKE